MSTSGQDLHKVTLTVTCISYEMILTGIRVIQRYELWHYHAAFTPTWQSSYMADMSWPNTDNKFRLYSLVLRPTASGSDFKPTDSGSKALF